MDVDQSSIHALASAFRRAFESEDLSDAPGFLSGLPKGCCSWATWMIGHFLMFEMQVDAEEVNGERWAPNGTDPHAWLEVGSTIVDITSDEFEDSDVPVIVSDESEWHRTWTVRARHKIKPIETHDAAFAHCSVKPSDIYYRLVARVRSEYGRA